MNKNYKYAKTYRLKHPERFRLSQEKWRKKNPEKIQTYQRKAEETRKRLAYEAYGGFQCICCGETEKLFLTIDHINNDGAQHRKKSHMSGTSFYSWLRKHKYPAGFQILCRNCNWGKHANGGKCPHTLVVRPRRQSPSPSD